MFKYSTKYNGLLEPGYYEEKLLSSILYLSESLEL